MQALVKHSVQIGVVDRAVLNCDIVCSDDNVRCGLNLVLESATTQVECCGYSAAVDLQHQLLKRLIIHVQYYLT